MGDSSEEGLAGWAQAQRALARSLGLSIEEWLVALEAAGGRTTGLTAAVIGAAMAKGLGLSVLDGLDGPKLAARARLLIDPTPPRVENPVLKEAIRRAADGPTRSGGLLSGEGRNRLKAQRPDVPTPRRATGSLGESANEGSADAPGELPVRPRLKPTREEEE